MAGLVEEHRLDCPFCGEPITILVDLSAGTQSYIEDCEVCCRPMNIAVEAEDGELYSVTADS